jgi:hypothetical protein
LRRWLIGIDEAGYGPKMGPLVIGASIWSMPAERSFEALLPELEPEFQSRSWSCNCNFIPLGDSKVIYQPKGSLQGLAVAIRFLLGLQDISCNSTSELLEVTCPSDAVRVQELPWYSSQLDATQIDDASEIDMPLDSDDMQSIVTGVAIEKLNRLGIRFHGLRCRVIDEEAFNRTVAAAGNKSNALGEWSLGLLEQCVGWIHENSFEERPIQIEACCDRQGGRKRYAPLLNRAFQDWGPWFEIVEEDTQCSRYRGAFWDLDLHVRFQVQGDSLLPAASASMLAKWVRELMMLRLNRYWRTRVGKDLKPTAGYPVDAERFKKAIAGAIDPSVHASHRWWRSC